MEPCRAGDCATPRLVPGGADCGSPVDIGAARDAASLSRDCIVLRVLETSEIRNAFGGFNSEQGAYFLAPDGGDVVTPRAAAFHLRYLGSLNKRHAI